MLCENEFGIVNCEYDYDYDYECILRLDLN